MWTLPAQVRGNLLPWSSVAWHADLPAIVRGCLRALLLAADPNFLLGFWTESARAWANASLAGEEQLLLFNALNQVSSRGRQAASLAQSFWR